MREAEFGSLQPEISLYEPSDALLGGADGLDVIRDLIPAAADVLVRGGRLAIEVGGPVALGGVALRALRLRPG